jgi:hypothetical protein
MWTALLRRYSISEPIFKTPRFDLATKEIPALQPFAFLVFGIVSTLTLYRIAIVSLSPQVPHHQRWMFQLTALLIFIFRFTIGLTLMNNYMKPIWAGVNLHNAIPYFGFELAKGVNAQALKDVLLEIVKLQQHIGIPNPINVFETLVFVGIEVLIGLSQFGMLIVSASSYIFIGVYAVVGQIFIAFFVSFEHSRLFWKWVDGLVSYSLYPFTASLVGFVFSEIYLHFFTKGVNGDYSLGHLSTLLVFLATLTPALILTMWKVPELTDRLFSNFGTLGQSITNSLQSITVNAASFAIRHALR